MKGIQYSDGRFVERDDWPEYEAEGDRRHEMWRGLLAEAEQRPAPTQVKPPFDARHGETAAVEGDVPQWLGRQVASLVGEQPGSPHDSAAGGGEPGT